MNIFNEATKTLQTIFDPIDFLNDRKINCIFRYYFFRFCARRQLKQIAKEAAKKSKSHSKWKMIFIYSMAKLCVCIVDDAEGDESHTPIACLSLFYLPFFNRGNEKEKERKPKLRLDARKIEMRMKRANTINVIMFDGRMKILCSLFFSFETMICFFIASSNDQGKKKS